MRSRIVRGLAVIAMAGVLTATAAAQSMARPHLADDDVTPPELTSIELPASIDVSRTLNHVLLGFKATDDLSGVFMGSARAVGPHGQEVHFSFLEEQPRNKISRAMTAIAYPFLEAGEYTLMSAFLSDVAGNLRVYDQATLSALGRTTFTVKNKVGYDVVPPTLRAGKILTPELSLSANHPGTDLAPYAAVNMDVLDTGNTALAGTIYASATFCVPGRTTCLGVYCSDERGLRKAASTMRLGGQLSRGFLAPGVYKLYNVSLTDGARNVTYLYSTEFGGETDFSLYFPSTTITLTP